MAVFIPIPSARVSTARSVKAGDLSNWRMAKRRSIMGIFDFGFSIFDWRNSFGAERVDWVHESGAACETEVVHHFVTCHTSLVTSFVIRREERRWDRRRWPGARATSRQ